MPAKTKKTVKAKPKPAARAARPASGTKATAAANAARPAKVAEAARETAPRPTRAVRRSSAELHFTDTTIIRGEAVEPGEAAPSGATHEIAGHDASGQPILKRKRFSIC
jgi:hypothetical protein